MPTGAGLGGGSGNAATALWAANELTGRPASNAQLLEWSADVGSDVPVFFSRGAAYCTGRGEVRLLCGEHRSQSGRRSASPWGRMILLRSPDWRPAGTPYQCCKHTPAVIPPRGILPRKDVGIQGQLRSPWLRKQRVEQAVKERTRVQLKWT